MVGDGRLKEGRNGRGWKVEGRKEGRKGGRWKVEGRKEKMNSYEQKEE